MEIEEEVYKVGNTPKNTNRSEFESASHGRKLKVGEAASLTNPEKGRSGKRNTNDAGHPIDQPNGKKIRSRCMAPVTPRKSAKYSNNNPRSMSLSNHTKRKNSVPVATKIV